MNKLFRNEPVRFFEALRLILMSFVGALAVFTGWSPTEAQLVAIGGLYVSLSAFMTAVVRSSVTPVNPVAEPEPDLGT